MNHFVDRWLQKLSDDPLQRRNVFWMIVGSLFGGAGSAFIAGPVVQTFLVEVGLTEGQLGLHGSVASTTGALSLLALMGVGDRFARILRSALCVPARSRADIREGDLVRARVPAPGGTR